MIVFLDDVTKRGFVPVAQVISRDRKTSLSPASAKFPMFFASSCTGFPGSRPDIWPRNCRSEKDPTEKKSYATSDYPQAQSQSKRVAVGFGPEKRLRASGTSDFKR